tara:strand:- start:4869 stop:5117 length:249 start_codon:yes stop_codon:yes gene_type:complete
MQTIEEKMMAANKARTDILSDNPEINSKWTPNAIKLVKQKEKMLKNDCVHTELYEAQAELIDLWVKEEEKRLPPQPPMSPFG